MPRAEVAGEVGGEEAVGLELLREGHPPIRNDVADDADGRRRGGGGDSGAGSV